MYYKECVRSTCLCGACSGLVERECELNSVLGMDLSYMYPNNNLHCTCTATFDGTRVVLIQLEQGRRWSRLFLCIVCMDSLGYHYL